MTVLVRMTRTLTATIEINTSDHEGTQDDPFAGVDDDEDVVVIVGCNGRLRQPTAKP